MKKLNEKYQWKMDNEQTMIYIKITCVRKISYSTGNSYINLFYSNSVIIIRTILPLSHTLLPHLPKQIYQILYSLRSWKSNTAYDNMVTSILNHTIILLFYVVMVQSLVFVKKHNSELISIKQQHLPMHKVLSHRCLKAFSSISTNTDSLILREKDVLESIVNTKVKTQTSMTMQQTNS
jgi:hypothetical protein